MNGGYKVVLRRSNREIEIPEGSTILWTLLQQGVEVAYSCGGGLCGACEVDVLAGEPEHRDLILTEEAQAKGKSMMICVSQSKTPVLELDL